MRSLPNMTVVSPSDAVSTEKLINAVADYNGPVYVRLGRLGVPVIYDESAEFEIGKAVEVHNGDDVAVIATGIMVGEALEAAKTLKEEGINVRVIDMHTIKPLDNEAVLKAAKDTKLIITAEEHNIIGGLGSAVSEFLSENYPVKVIKIGMKDTFGESGKPAELVEKYGLTANRIVDTIKNFL